LFIVASPTPTRPIDFGGPSIRISGRISFSTDFAKLLREPNNRQSQISDYKFQKF
jgi:hypothetical protein